MKRDWSALFDELKTKGQFKSDAQLAEHLGVTRSHVSAWRNGKSDLGTITKLRVLDALGNDSLRSAVLSLLSDTHPDDGADKQLKLVSRLESSVSAQLDGARAANDDDDAVSEEDAAAADEAGSPGNLASADGHAFRTVDGSTPESSAAADSSEDSDDKPQAGAKS
jgi:transcriptional regulator with XRE-family HTH domain